MSIYKKIIRDRKNLTLSYGARFLHCLLRVLSELENWNITITGLSTEMGISRPTIIKFLKELKDQKLIDIQRIKESYNSYLWIVYPIPKDEYNRRMNGCL